MTDFGEAAARVEEQIMAAHAIPEPLFDRRLPDSPRVAYAKRLLRLGYFGEVDCIDGPAYLRAAGGGDGTEKVT